MSKINLSLIKELRNRTGVGITTCKSALLQSNGDIELAIQNLRIIGKIKASKKSINAVNSGIILAKMSLEKDFVAMLQLSCETDFVSREQNFLNFGQNIIQYVVNNKIDDLNFIQKKYEEKRIEILSKLGENIQITKLSTLVSSQLDYYLHNNRIGVLISLDGEKNNKKLIHDLAIHIAASNPEYINQEDIPKDIIEKEKKIQFKIIKKSTSPRKLMEKIISARINKFIDDIVLTKQQFIFDQTKTVYQVLKENNMIIKKFVRFELNK
ncbi:MAG: translation elongation factor Ts [Arsenophonus sp.]|nr:MAG: translation elongation factor Ts [Arsenophonus sp.]